MTTEELEIWKKLNECKRVKKAFKQSKWISGDMFTIIDEAKTRIYPFNDHCEGCSWEVRNCNVIRIIPLYHPVCPERSLMGIAYEKCFSVNPWRGNDLKWHCSIAWIDTKTKSVMEQQTHADRPDLALAKAIIEQEEK